MAGYWWMSASERSWSRGRQTVSIEEKTYLVEPALTADVAIVHAKKADPYGNLVYDKSGRNLNPLVAMAGKITIAEVDEIVPLGELDPESIVTPGIFVDMVILSRGVNLGMGMGKETRDRIAKRAAQELKNGMVVNLGIGIPTKVADYVPEGIHVVFHAENGILGAGGAPLPGEEDAFLCNAGGYPITIIEGASYCDSCHCFCHDSQGMH